MNPFLNNKMKRAVKFTNIINGKDANIRGYMHVNKNATIYGKLCTNIIQSIKPIPIKIGPVVKIDHLIVDKLEVLGQQLSKTTDEFTNSNQMDEFDHKFTKMFHELQNTLNIMSVDSDIVDTLKINKKSLCMFDRNNKIISSPILSIDDSLISAKIKTTNIIPQNDYIYLDHIQIKNSEIVCNGVLSKLGIITPQIIGPESEGVNVEGIQIHDGKIIGSKMGEWTQQTLKFENSSVKLTYEYAFNPITECVHIQFDPVKLKSKSKLIVCKNILPPQYMPSKPITFVVWGDLGVAKIILNNDELILHPMNNKTILRHCSTYHIKFPTLNK